MRAVRFRAENAKRQEEEAGEVERAIGKNGVNAGGSPDNYWEQVPLLPTSTNAVLG
jgi:hypothetical protein